MSEFISQIRARAKNSSRHIILPRSSDNRVIEAANYLAAEDLVQVSLVKENGANLNQLHSAISVVDPESDEQMEVYAAHLAERRKHKGWDLEKALTVVHDPLYYAASLVQQGKANGAVAGSISTTADVIRAALYVIGMEAGNNVISSVFVMSFDDGKIFTYGDCAVVPYPDEEQLSQIATTSAKTHEKLTGETPKTAMLSFSTKGSADHERVELVRNALELAQKREPGLAIDGELQFDAAYLPEIAKRKAGDSEVAGKANVYIFPNLDAGNIAYKITERLGGASATGPVIQGLSKPFMDLSRGCSWEDIVNTVCVCALMA